MKHLGIVATFLFVMYASLLIAESPDKPNILWLTSEDNNVQWVGCYGNKYAETPNIDRLAVEGFRYTHCYANAPVCAPSRSTWITGVHALSMGTHPMRSRYNIPHGIIRYYPDLLKEAGYYVSNGAKTDYNIGGREDLDCWDDADKSKGEDLDINWDALSHDKPFFKVVNFIASHESRAQGNVDNTICHPDSIELRSYHPDVPDMRKTYAKYHDAVKRMDTKVGEVLHELEKRGLADNTIVVYCSDHGGVLPRSKRYLFSSGIHSPLVIRIPEKYKSLYPAKKTGTTVDRMVSFIDMPKTFLSLAEAEVPDYMQGTIFLGKAEEKEKEYHFAFRGRMDSRNENARAVYDKEFVYIRNYMPYVPWMQHLDYLWKMKGTQAWEEYVKTGQASPKQAKYFSAKEYTEEFYRLENDWDNTNNLIDDKEYSKRIEAMRGALRHWQLDIYDSALLPESEMVKRAKDNNTSIYEMVRNKELYNLPALLDAADVALEHNPEHIDQLRNMLSDKDGGIRYWAMVGAFLLNDEAAALMAINDKSHEVRAMAAWTLIRTGKQQAGFACLKSMLQDNSYATLKILNIIDWMGEDGEELMPTVRLLDIPDDRKNYASRMKVNLEKKF